MTPVQVVRSQYFDTSAAQLFAVIRDSERLGELTGLPIKLIRQGSEPGGSGTVRRVGPPLIGAQETIVELVPDQAVHYQISRNGGPIRRHRALMSLTPQGHGVRLTWRMDFETPWLLSGLMKFALTYLAQLALRRLQRNWPDPASARSGITQA